MSRNYKYPERQKELSKLRMRKMRAKRKANQDLIGGVFTRDFCKKIYELENPGKTYRPTLIKEIARTEAWEMATL